LIHNTLIEWFWVKLAGYSDCNGKSLASNAGSDQKQTLPALVAPAGSEA
jgi:hypothetical protein